MIRRLAVAAALAAFAVVPLAPAASAHRSGCHTKHVCPSDHATYRWRGVLCVSPSADERTAKFKRKVRYDGRTYYCRG